MSIKYLRYLLISLLILGIKTHDHFPEEYTPLDFITNSTGEKLLMAYYFYDPVKSIAPPTYKYDYRNGIIVYPFIDVIRL
jgi:hypothetical protein